MATGITLRVWEPSDDEESGDPMRTVVSAKMTLTEYFERVHAARLDDRQPGTVVLYRDAMRWWKSLTGDPPIEGIDQATIAAFQGSLRDARYRRGRCGPWRPLSAASRAKIERSIRAVLRHLGPDEDDLIRKPPKLRPTRAESSPAGSWTIEEARAMVAASASVRKPAVAECSPANWWRGFFALAGYTGLRVGSLLSLRRRHLVQREDGWWLDVDAESMSKVKRRKQCALHRLAVEAIAGLPAGGPDTLLLPWPRDLRCMLDVHYEIQTAAGIPEERQHELHGWRRWHGNAMADLGFAERLELARESLGHSSSSVTERHYVSSLLRLARMLPDLW